MSRLILTCIVLYVAAATKVANAEYIFWDPAEGGNGHAYKFVDKRVNWHQAVLEATTIAPPEGFGLGHLLTISNAQEEAFVSVATDKRTVWLGFTDEVLEGEWRWIDDTPGIWQDPNYFPSPTQTAYTNWYSDGTSSEPNNLGDEDYGIFNYYNTAPPGIGTWNDGSLSSWYLIPYIVEWEPLVVPVPAPNSLTCLLGVGVMVFGGRWLKQRRRCA